MTVPGPIPARPDSSRRTGRLATTVLVLAPPAAFVIPFIGPLFSTVVTIVLAAMMGTLVWPVRRWVATMAGVAVVIAIVLVLGVVGVALDQGNVLGFQLVPLCGPDPGSVWIVSAVIAVLGYGLAAAASVRLRRIWLWPVAAAIGAGLYLATWTVAADALDVRWIC